MDDQLFQPNKEVLLQPLLICQNWVYNLYFLFFWLIWYLWQPIGAVLYITPVIFLLVFWQSDIYWLYKWYFCLFFGDLIFMAADRRGFTGSLPRVMWVSPSRCQYFHTHNISQHSESKYQFLHFPWIHSSLFHSLSNFNGFWNGIFTA